MSSRYRIASVVAAVVALGALVPVAQAASWSSATKISSVLTGATSPAVLVDDAGGTTVVWNNGNRLLGASRPAGGSWSEPEPISETGAVFGEPRLTQAPNGTITAYWSSGVWLMTARKLADGTWGRQQEVVGNEGAQPEVVTGPDGAVTIAWARFASGPDVILVSAIHRPAGEPWGEEFPIAEGDAPDLAVDGEGNVVLAFDFWDGANSRAAYAELPDGGTWTDPEPLSDEGTDSDGTHVVVDSEGNTLITWQRHASPPQSLLERAYRPSGGAFGSPTSPTPAMSFPHLLDVVVDGDDRITTLWRTWNGVDNYTLWAQRQASAPGWVGANETSIGLLGADGNFGDPRVAAGGQTTAVVFKPVTLSGRATVRTITGPTGPWSAAVPLSSVGAQTDDPIVSVDRAGNAVAVHPEGFTPVLHASLFDVAGPVGSLAALPAAQRDSTFKVAWSAVDGFSSVSSYDVRARSARYDGGFGGYTIFRSGTTTTSATYSGAAGVTYCVSARATDTSGNVGGWSAERCTSTPVDDRTLKGAGWKKVSGAAHYLGTAKTTKLKGRTLSLANVTGRSFSIVAETCKGCGTVQVKLGSKLLKTVKLTSAGKRSKVLIPLASFASASTGKLTLKVRTDGKPVTVDGLVVGK